LSHCTVDGVQSNRVGSPSLRVLVGYQLAFSLLASALPALPRDFDATIFPVAAVQWAKNERIEGRLFAEFNWGGYVFQAWPTQRVFVESQQFYSEDLWLAYLRIASTKPGWRDELDRWNVTVVLFPVDTPLVRKLAADPHWELLYQDHVSGLLVRRE
jgi:hypothetical protein